MTRKNNKQEIKIFSDMIRLISNKESTAKRLLLKQKLSSTLLHQEVPENQEEEALWELAQIFLLQTMKAQARSADNACMKGMDLNVQLPNFTCNVILAPNLWQTGKTLLFINTVSYAQLISVTYIFRHVPEQA